MICTKRHGMLQVHYTQKSHCQQFYFLSFTSYTAQLNLKCTTDIDEKVKCTKFFKLFNTSNFAEKFITTFFRTSFSRRSRA